MKHKIKRHIRRVGQHVENLHSNIKDFSYQSKIRLERTKDLIIPDDYSFLLSERNRKITHVVNKVKVF